MPDSVYRILVVDDVLDNSFLLQTVLQAEGYEVECADNGQLALKKAELFSPHLILLDLMMPGMNGDEVVWKMQDSPNVSAIPIFLVTAYGESESIQSVEAHVEEIIHKPIDFENLLLRIKNLLVNKEIF
ncbi:response regulator [Leptolyngbya sp. PL-A3]|uniref:response regulator n=1 Tax=Leptolyngbya sp. PL-A3 TaxID=2933911 RepID=UPI0032979903